jgi:glycosyltransferase involved in cell wall biosynthesis
MKVALLTTDDRETDRAYAQTAPRYATGTDSLLEGFRRLPEVEVHVLSCVQRPVQTPEKLADNIWLHSLLVPKIGWLRTGYQGCIRAVRRKLAALKPDIVQGVGTERDCAISAVFSGFPNVVTIAGNMSELARIYRPRFGSYGWMTARLENFLLPRSRGVMCNSQYTERLVRSRAKKTWVVYPGLRSLFLQPPTRTGPRDCALVIAGIISPRKRQLELLNVAEALHRQGLKFEFRFVGINRCPDEPYAAAFVQRIKSMESTGCVRYLGAPSHSEMVRCFDAASGMIHFPT